MEAMTLLEHRPGPWTRAERDALPDDGRRHEIIDGVLIVTPAPSREHQRVSMSMSMLLSSSCPDHLEVLAAPFDVPLHDDTVVEPDVLVVRRDDDFTRTAQSIPLLAVEILSPRTRLIDLGLKRARYERAGSPAYWVIDPLDPFLTAWELRGDRFVEVAQVVDEESWTATTPFEVTVSPAALAR